MPAEAPIKIDIVGTYDKLQGALNGASSAVSSWGGAVGNIFGDVGKAIDDIGSRGRSMSIGLSSAGLESEAALARMAAGANAVGKSFTGAAAPVAALIVAIAGIAVIADYLKHAVSEASALQDAVVRLGGTLANMGEKDVSTASKQMEDFALTLSRTSTFTKTELVEAFVRLRPIVKSNAEAYRLLEIAMNLAGKTGMTLGDAIASEEAAYIGRAFALGKFGIAIKDAQGKMLDFNTIMQNTAAFAAGGASEATSTLSGKWQNLKNRMGDTATEIGTDLLPSLSHLVDFLHNSAIGAIEDTIVALIDLAEVMGRPFSIMEHQIAGLSHVLTAIPLVLAGNFKLAGRELHIAGEQFKAMAEQFTRPLSDRYAIFGQPDTGAVPKISRTVTNRLKEPKDTGQAAKDALSNAEQAIADSLAASKQSVDMAKALVDRAKAQAENYKANLPGGQIRTQEEAVKYASLLNAELTKEASYRATLHNEQRAENAAADAYQKLAEHVSTKLKTHVELHNQLLTKANAHRTAALAISAAYESALGPIIAIRKELEAIPRSLADRTISEVQKIAKGQEVAVQQQIEAVRLASDKAALRPQATSQKDAFAVQTAQLQVALDSVALAVNQKVLEIDRATKGTDPNKLIADQDAVDQAFLKLRQSTDNLIIAQDRGARDLHNASLSITMLKDAVGTAGDKFGQLVASGVNPLIAALEIAVQYSVAFKLMQEIVVNLFRVLAAVLDAVLLPIVKTLNSVLVFLVNIFIDLWNAVAAFLGVLGIHVAMLRRLTTLFGDLGSNIRPLLDVVHDLPTIKEYGAGKYGPLQPDQYMTGVNQLQNSLLLPLNTHTTILEKVAGALVLGVALWEAANVLLAAILINPSIAGFKLCPEVDQEIETRDRGFIRAGDLKVGDFLRDLRAGEWNEVRAVEIRPTTVYRFTTEVETIGVNREHAVMDINGQWVEVRNLKPGDKILRYPEGELTIQSVECMGEGKYAAINCDRHRYVLGTSVGHNDSGQAIVAALHHVADRVNTGGAAGMRPPSSSGAMVGGADNSLSITQNISIGNVNKVAGVKEVLDVASFDADRLLRTRQFAVGNLTA